jgi:hypothetical protein
MVVHIYNIKLLRKLRLWYEANKSKSARPYLKNKLKRKAVELFAKQAQGQIQFLVWPNKKRKKERKGNMDIFSLIDTVHFNAY